MPRAQKLIIWTAGLLACGDPFGGQRYDSMPSRSAKKLLPGYFKTGQGKSASSVNSNLPVALCDNSEMPAWRKIERALYAA